MTEEWHWKRLGEPYDAHGGIDDVVPAITPWNRPGPSPASFIRNAESNRLGRKRYQAFQRIRKAEVALHLAQKALREAETEALAPAGATIAAEAEGQGGSTHDPPILAQKTGGA